MNAQGHIQTNCMPDVGFLDFLALLFDEGAAAFLRLAFALLPFGFALLPVGFALLPLRSALKGGGLGPTGRVKVHMCARVEATHLHLFCLLSVVCLQTLHLPPSTSFL